MYEWVNNSELNIVDFSVNDKYKYQYEIEGIKYPNNNIDKYSINEIFFGDIKKHSFYISKNKANIASIDNLDNIMILVFIKNEQLKKY